jgi:hypothetical protein
MYPDAAFKDGYSVDHGLKILSIPEIWYVDVHGLYRERPCTLVILNADGSSKVDLIPVYFSAAIAGMMQLMCL